MSFLPGPETRAAVLRHPFVLAGLAVVALLALTAGVLVIIDSGRGDDAGTPAVEVQPKNTATPSRSSRTATAIGVTATTNTTAGVRAAPGRGAILGTLPRNSELQVDGRSEDTGWLRVIFPANSDRHGWIDAELVDIAGDPETLVVATAEPPVIVDIPTSPPVTETPTPEEGSATPTGTLTPEGALPDLVVGTTPTISDGKLFVTIENIGSGAMEGDLVVAGFNPDQTALLGGATVPAFTLPAGRSIDVGTGYEVVGTESLLLIVDPNGDIEESDNTNNQITIALSVEEEPTPPLPFETPLGE